MKVPVTVAFPQEWRGLWTAQLNKKTPIASSDVEDDDPKPYRRDSRIWFEAFPDRLHQTHHAILRLESDDHRYRLFFTLEELPDEKVEKSHEVFRREIAELKEQDFTFSLDEVQKINVRFKAHCQIHVYIVEAKAVS